tara:strand:- start:3 stop:179 length:177 start_codon:yes stop_codon:yes gene_type:complete
MPIWLRNFTFKKMKEYYDNQNSNQENEKSWLSKDTPNQHQKVQAPDFFKNLKGKGNYK